MLESMQRKYEERQLREVFVRLNGNEETVFHHSVRELMATLGAYSPDFKFYFDPEDQFYRIGLPPVVGLAPRLVNGIFAVMEANPLPIGDVDPRAQSAPVGWGLSCVDP